MRFYLGSHVYSWLWDERCDVPLFVSRRTLAGRKSRYPRATHRWALDSGGFSELSMYGEWRTSPEQYVDEVHRFADEIGSLDWAAAQDWMCEPWITEKTGKTVHEHQRRTVENYLDLIARAPELPWTPVLQGWALRDYWAHVGMYIDAGVDLSALPTVGIGSVCRRQHTAEVEGLIRALHAVGVSLHGFGFKVRGMARVADALTSADSLAWSYAARRQPPLEGCTGHRNCANCMRYALAWRARLCG